MSDLLQTGLAWLAGKLKTYVSQTVVYWRGTASVSLAATFGRSEAERIDESGVGVRVESRDFIVAAADLVLDGATTTPRRGDAIVVTEGAVQRRYEVMTLGDSHYRPCDPFGKQIRIHTKLVLTT